MFLYAGEHEKSCRSLPGGAEADVAWMETTTRGQLDILATPLRLKSSLAYRRTLLPTAYSCAIERTCHRSHSEQWKRSHGLSRAFKESESSSILVASAASN